MIMKDLIELLCAEEEIDEEYGKQCCMDGRAEIEVQGLILIINTLDSSAVT